MRRGFSLIEMMAALVIAAVIVAGATGAVMTINRIVADTSRRAVALDEAKRLEEYLTVLAQGAGGGAVRPHAALLVENAGGDEPPALPPSTGGMGCRELDGLPDCDAANQGADRLTVLTLVSEFPACAVTGVTGVNLNVGAGSSSCCLDDATGGLDSWDGRQALIVGNAAVASVALNSPNSSGPNCKTNAPPGQGSGLLPAALAAVGYPATLVVVEARTMFVDRTTHELKYWTDLNGNGDADDDEFTVVHDGVYDFQVALGFDGLPEDGILDDNVADDDEFLFNHVDDAAFPGNGNLADVASSQLRMMEIAVAVGTHSQVSGGNSVQLLDRAAPISVANVHLVQTASKAYLRNLAVFTQ